MAATSTFRVRDARRARRRELRSCCPLLPDLAGLAARLPARMSGRALRLGVRGTGRRDEGDARHAGPLQCGHDLGDPPVGDAGIRMNLHVDGARRNHAAQCRFQLRQCSRSLIEEDRTGPVDADLHRRVSATAETAAVLGRLAFTA
jgi:hypothetical protein